MPYDARNANTRAVSNKIADAAMNLYGMVSNAPVNEHVVRALRQHLSMLIAHGVSDNQTLLDEGVAFLRRQEVKRLK